MLLVVGELSAATVVDAVAVGAPSGAFVVDAAAVDEPAAATVVEASDVERKVIADGKVTAHGNRTEAGYINVVATVV